MPVAAHPHIVVMGVSGCGKSTVGELLAARLELPFLDADSLHPITNVDKMAKGVPLTDEDRRPWLEEIGRRMAQADGGLVVACSALRRSYRELILSQCPTAFFVHLDGSRELLLQRLSEREGHFMPASLLDSQLATLEPLADDEPGTVLSLDAPGATPETLAGEAESALADEAAPAEEGRDG